MLVLSRSAGRCIWIGNSICIAMIGIRGNQAIIGIEAPLDLNIVREELIDLDNIDDIRNVYIKRRGVISCRQERLEKMLSHPQKNLQSSSNRKSTATLQERLGDQFQRNR